uniref:DDE_Tnp_1_7 domain-containing protein n=1 Tax=Heterorhabditis bacteriophora TaxID=37862 RepID=A0A1I7WPQ3_HETBA
MVCSRDIFSFILNKYTEYMYYGKYTFIAMNEYGSDYCVIYIKMKIADATPESRVSGHPLPELMCLTDGKETNNGEQLSQYKLAYKSGILSLFRLNTFRNTFKQLIKLNLKAVIQLWKSNSGYLDGKVTLQKKTRKKSITRVCKIYLP